MSGILVSPALIRPSTARSRIRLCVFKARMKEIGFSAPAAMAGQEQPVAPCDQLVERACNRPSIHPRDDRRCPGHDVIGRKQDAGVLEREGHVIGGVSGRVDTRQPPAVALDRSPIRKRDIGRNAMSELW